MTESSGSEFCCTLESLGDPRKLQMPASHPRHSDWTGMVATCTLGFSEGGIAKSKNQWYNSH